MPLPPGSQGRLVNRIDFSDVPPRKQDMTGTPYVDHTARSASADLLHQAQNAAENNKLIAQQRDQRGKIYNDSWNRAHESPVRDKMEQPSPAGSQPPPMSSNAAMNAPQKPMATNQSSHLMSPQMYNRDGSINQHSNVGHSTSGHGNVTHAPSPARQSVPAIPPNIQHTSQNRSVYNPSHHAPQTSPYGYHPQAGQMWGQPPPQPQQHTQQSPISPSHPSLPHYSPSLHQAQPQLQHHPMQSPHAAPPPQLHHTQSSGSMHGNMNYQTMSAMPRVASGTPYAGMSAGRNMYNPALGSPRSGQPQQQQQQQHQQQQQQQQANYMNQITAAQQAGLHYTAPATGQQGQGAWGGYPVSSGY